MTDTLARLNEFRPESVDPDVGGVIAAEAEIRVPHDGTAPDLGVGAVALAFYDAAGRLVRLSSFDGDFFSPGGDGFGYASVSVRSDEFFDDEAAEPAVAVALVEGASAAAIEAGAGAVVEFVTAATPVEAVDGPAAGLTPLVPLDPAGAPATPDAAAGGFTSIQRLESGAWEFFDGAGTFGVPNAEAGLRVRVADVLEGAAGERTPMPVEITRLGSAADAAGVITLSVSDEGSSFFGDDFDPDSLPSELSFAAGQRTRTTALDILGDDRPEPDERVAVSAFDETGGFFARGAGLILNDDGPIVEPPRLNEFLPGGDGFFGDIELRAPSGLPLSGQDGAWRVALYDAEDGGLDEELEAGIAFSFWNRDALYDYYRVFPVEESAFLQGAPAGIALVAPDGAVTEFFATATSFDAVDGPAAGLTAAVPLDPTGAPALPDDETAAFVSTQRLEDGSWEIFDVGANFFESTFGFANETAGLRVRGGEVDEGGPGETAELPFTITRLGDVSEPLTLSLSLFREDGFFSPRGDYDPGSIPASIAFEAGERERVVAVTVLGNDRPEPDVTLRLQAFDESGALFAQSTGTIRDDDGPIIETPRINEIEAGDEFYDGFGGVEIRAPKGVSLSGEAGAWRVAFYAADGGERGAAEGFFSGFDDAHDYHLFYPPVDLETPIAPGDPFGVALIAPDGAVVDFVSTGPAFTATDGAAEGETATAIRGPDGEALAAPGRFGSFQRLDGDVWFTGGEFVNTLGRANGGLRVVGGEVVEPDPGETATLGFTIERLGDASAALDVEFFTDDFNDLTTALPFVDYQPLSGSARFEPGQTTIEVSVTVFGDAIPEFAETVALAVEDFAFFTITTGVGAILDSDGPPEISARINEIDIPTFFFGDFLEIRLTANAAPEDYAVSIYDADGALTATAALDDVDFFVREGRDNLFDYYVLRGFLAGEEPEDAPPGVALAGPDGLIEFVSWRGALTGVDGPAEGVAAALVEGPDPDGDVVAPPEFPFGSAQRTADGGWRFAFDRTPGRGNFLNFDGRGIDLRIADVEEPGPGETVAMTVTLERIGDVSAAETFGIALDVFFEDFDGFIENDFVGLGVALPGVDFDPRFPRFVAFEPGQTTLSFEITVFGDDQPEFDEVIPLVVFGDGQFAVAEGTIRDPDGPPEVEVRFNEVVYGAPGFPFAAAVEVRLTANAPTFDDATDADFYDVVVYDSAGGVVTSLNAIDDAGEDALRVARTDGTFDYFALELPFGAGDALALVDLRDGAVLEFLSFSAPVTAAEGPAEGLTATVLADADGTPLTQGPGSPVFTSIQRLDDGAWVQRPNENSIGFRTKAPGLSVFEGTERFEDETRLAGQLWIGSDGEDPGVLEIVGGALDVETTLWAGDGGQGELRLAGGAALQVGDPARVHPDGEVSARIGVNGGTGAAIIEGGATLRVDAPGAYAGTEFFRGGYDTVRIGGGGGSGDVRVSGPGSALIGAGDSARIDVGFNGGEGSLRVSDGGLAGAFTFEVGRRGEGEIVLEGAGSSLRASNAYGRFGFARWEVEAGGLRLGRGGGEDGETSGVGRMTIAGGAVATIDNIAGLTSGARVALGRDLGGEGFLTVTGAGSRLDIVQDGPVIDYYAPRAVVGDGGYGRATVTDGGVLAITGDGARMRVGRTRETFVREGDGYEGHYGYGGYYYSYRPVWRADGRESLLEIGAGGSVILDAGAADGARLTVGDTPNARGRVTVSGEGARLVARSDSTAPGQYGTGDLEIGARGGAGALVVESGGYVNARALSVGAGAGYFYGYGQLGGDGYAAVRDGGRIALTLSDGTAYQGLRIGLARESVGRVVVEGEGSEIAVSGGAGRIGAGLDGEGALEIRAGGRVLGFFAQIGRGGESVGLVEVDGAGSLLRLSDDQGFFPDFPADAAFLQIGRDEGASGRLSITAGGRVEVTNGPDSDRDAPGVTLARNEFSNGALEVIGRSADGVASALTIRLYGPSDSGGGAAAAGYYAGPFLVVGRQGEGLARVAEGGEIDILGEGASLVIGQGGGFYGYGAALESALRIESGGRVLVDSGESRAAAGVRVGPNVGGRGRLEVDGAGSLLTIASANVDDIREGGYRYGAFLTVGQRGEGALEVTGGGRIVIDGDDDRFPAFLIGRGVDDGSVLAVGAARVAGEGSSIAILGTSGAAYGSAGFIEVGGRAGARGELVIEDGGAVTNAAANSATTVATRAGSEGFLRVASGGVLNAGTGLLVGARGFDDGRVDPADGGAGVLELDGGRVVARRAMVGETGEIRGAGVLAADLALAGGTLSPGFSTGTLTIEGALTATATAEIALEIDALAEGAADRLVVTGAAEIDAAALRFVFGDGDLGAPGDSVTLIEAGSLRLTNIDVAGQLAAFFGGFPDPGPVSLDALGLSTAVLVADERGADGGARLTATALGDGAGGGGALDFSGAAGGARFTAVNGVGAGTGGGFDAFFAFGVSEVTGSDAGDVIALSQTSGVTIRGGAGNDVLTGGAGDDLIEGGAGDDVIRPGLGNDRIVLGAGADVVLGTAAELDGDVIVDFGAEDRIGVLGEGGVLLDAAITVAGGEIRIDVGRNGVIDAVMVSESAFEGVQDGLTGAAPLPAARLSVQGAGFLSQRRAEGGPGEQTPFVFEVIRTGDLSEAITARWTVTGVGAAPADGADFVGGVLPSGVATLPAGAARATVTVLVAGDDVVEPDEDFEFRLLSAETATGAPVAIADAATRARILNDDIAPLAPEAPAATISIRPGVGAVDEGGTLTFIVTRDGDARGEAVVSYVIGGVGDAPARGSNVVGGLPQTGTVTLPDGARSATISVRTVDDATAEPNRTVRVTLTDARVGDGPIRIDGPGAFGTIIDNDFQPPPPPPPSRAVVFGDPHLVTLDGVGYSFQAVGEFTLFETAGDAPIEAQIRTVPQPGSDLVSVIAAVATRLGDATLMIDALGPESALVDGAPVALTATSGPLTVGDGRLFFDGAVYTVVYATGEQIRVERQDGFLNVSTFLDEGRAVSGLLGNFDGDPTNEFALRDGTALGERLDFATLYGAFADSWRITDETSFFTYAEGEDTDAFTDRSFPRAEADVAALPPELRAAAEAAARAAGVTDPLLLEFAALDFALTGDARFTAAASGVEATPQTRVRPLDAPAPPPTFGVFADRERLVEGDTGQTDVVFTLWRGGDLEAAVDVLWRIGGTVDAEDLAEGTAFEGAARFAPGQTATTVTVAVLGDETPEPDEALILSIALDRDAHPDALIAAPAATVIVENDDFEPALISLTAIEPEAPEGDEQGGVATFRLARTGDPEAAVAVTLRIAGAGETPAGDGDIVGGLRDERVVFTPGEMVRVIEVGFVPNRIPQPDRGFALTLLDPEGGAIDGPATVEGTILDDDEGAPSDPVIRLTGSADRYIALGADDLVVDGGDGPDVIVGGSGDDRLFGGAGADLLIGGPGSDVLVGGPGSDTLRGGPGADIYAFAATDFLDGEVDFVEGFESGVDRLEFFGFDGLATFDELDIRPLGPSQLIALPGGGGIVLRDVAGPLTEADVIFADAPRTPGGAAEPGVVRLGDGSERFITTHDGPLEVFTGAGVDVVVIGGSGGATLRAGEGSKVLIGGGGDDTFFVGPSGANLTGGSGADRFVFSAVHTPASGLLVDFIEDFESGVDQVALEGFAGLDSVEALTFRPLGADLALELAANRLVVFRGVATADQLDDADFLFGVTL